MGRLREEFLGRIETFCDRMLDVADALAAKGCSRRITDQITGCGTSIGANAYEADEAMSRKDFCKCLGIAKKELNESRFWVRTTGRRRWLDPGSLTGLEQECLELKRILGAMIRKTRESDTR